MALRVIKLPNSLGNGRRASKGFYSQPADSAPKIPLALKASLRSFRLYIVLNYKLFGGDRRPAPIDGVHDEDTYPSAYAVALGGVRFAGICQLVLQSPCGHLPEHRVGTQSAAPSGS